MTVFLWPSCRPRRKLKQLQPQQQGLLPPAKQHWRQSRHRLRRKGGGCLELGKGLAAHSPVSLKGQVICGVTSIHVNDDTSDLRCRIVSVLVVSGMFAVNCNCSYKLDQPAHCAVLHSALLCIMSCCDVLCCAGPSCLLPCQKQRRQHKLSVSNYSSSMMTYRCGFTTIHSVEVHHM